MKDFQIFQQKDKNVYIKMNRPTWLKDELCISDNNPKDCTWYTKITNVSGGPDTSSLQWLDWDETNKKFIWANQTVKTDTKHQFWIKPETDKTYMRVARTKDPTHDADWYGNLSGDGGEECNTQSNITSDCIIHHDRGPGNNSYNCRGGCLCVGDSWDPSSWNDTTNAGKGNSGTTCCDSNSDGKCLCAYDNTTDVNNTSWTINTGPNDGGLYNYVNQYTYTTELSPFGPSACYDKTIPRYFAFGKPDGDNVGTYPGNNENRWHKNNYRNGCGVDSTTALNQLNCQSAGGLPSDNTSLNNYNWISEKSAMSCCGLPTSQADAYPQCGNISTGNGISPRGAFNPCALSSGGYCSLFMNLNCKDAWNTCATQITDQTTCEQSCSNTATTASCDNFLANGSCQAVEAVRTNISEYINNSSRTPTDYISWKLKKVKGSPSYNYYNDNNCGDTPPYNPDDPGEYRYPGSGNKCDRDDSYDPYFINTLPYLCNRTCGFLRACPGDNNQECNDLATDSQGNLMPGTPTTRCDDLLHYFCQQFTREDVEADATLVSICGCSLNPPGHIPYQPPFVNGDYWKQTEGTAPATSAYDTSVPNTTQCDTPCMSSRILQSAGSCVADYCIIDGVTLNYINSNPGDTNISQQCGDCGDSGTCQCYMGDITVNEFNSNNKGGLNISQYCENCYQTDASGTYIQVNCQTGVPLNVDDPTDPTDPDTPDVSKPWWKKKITIIMAVIIILAFVLFLGFWYSSYHRTQSVPEQVQTFDDYYYY